MRIDVLASTTSTDESGDDGASQELTVSDTLNVTSIMTGGPGLGEEGKEIGVQDVSAVSSSSMLDLASASASPARSSQRHPQEPRRESSHHHHCKRKRIS